MANKNFQVKFGLEVGSTVTADAATGNITTNGDVAVNGGDITTTSATATVVNTNATTVNMAGAGTTVAIGANSGTLTIGNPTVVGTQATQNLFNTVATTLNIGGGATTSVNIGNAAGEIDTPSDIQIIGNKSVRQGNSPYAGSSDILRDANGNAVEGYLASNNGMTAADTAFVSRNYGQSFPNATATTAGPGKIYLIGTRGTAASPLANNINNIFGQIIYSSNLGDTTGGGTGTGWTNDFAAINGQPAGTIVFAAQNHRQTLQATLTGSIAGTTLTVTAVASGTIAPGQELRGTGFNQAIGSFTILRQLTTTAAANALGSTGTYQLVASPGTIASSTMMTYSITAGTAMRNYIQPSNVPINTASVVNYINSTPAGVGSTTFGLTNSTFTQSWFQFPQGQRIIREITGGNTLNIGTHGFTTAGASFTIVTAGNPNGLTTGTTYFVDTIPSATTITLRTNSVSGGAVTGLTNGTGLFIEARAEAVESSGGNQRPASMIFEGLRRSQNFAGVASQDNTRQTDWLGSIQYVGGFANGAQNANTRLFASATEDWSTGVKAGSQFNFTTTKTGTLTTFTSTLGASSSSIITDSFTIQNTAAANMVTVDSNGNVVVTGDIRINGGDIQNPGGTAAITLTSANTTTTIRGDTIDLRVAAGTAATSANIGYTRTYGEFAYTNAAGFNIPAQNTIYTMPLDTTLNNSGVTISGTGNININVSGWYKIIISLQITLTVSNQPGQIDFWLRKNGADVPNSKTQVDLLKDQKSVIAMDWLVNSNGTDYWEIVYVGTSANYADIDFPTIAATTTPYVSPVAPALIVNVIPAGMYP